MPDDRSQNLSRRSLLPPVSSAEQFRLRRWAESLRGIVEIDVSVVLTASIVRTMSGGGSKNF
jgi:hypothetical protein